MRFKCVFPKVMLILSIIFLYQVHSYSQCVPRVNFYYGEILPNNGCGTFTSVSPYSPGEYFRTTVLPGASYTMSTCGASIDTEITGFQGNTTATSIFYNDDNGPMCGGTQASITHVPNFNDYMRVAVQQFSCQPGGTASITVNLRQNNNLNITSSAADMCEGQVRNLTATPTAVTPAQPLAGDGGTFAGSGVSGTTFTAPAIGGTTQSITVPITYTFGYCTTTQFITAYNNPTTAAAGADQSICLSSVTLAGNNPSVGSGSWALVGGTGTVTTPSSPTSGVTGISVGSSTFRWTISNGPCTASFDDVIITRDAVPTTANAGPDQTICATTATLAGNTPSVGSGQWTLVGGSGSITTSTSPNSGVTGLGVGNNTFRWTISNGVCTPSTDDVIITRDDFPTTANAGPNRVVCDSTFNLAGNTPTVGTGNWSLIGGGGLITNPADPNSEVTGLPFGNSTFRWTISHGVCTPSLDDVVITRPTAISANAGPDQVLLVDSTAMAANTPGEGGSGIWALIIGSGSIDDATSPTTSITGLGYGFTVLSWTLDCGQASDADTVVLEVLFPKDVGVSHINNGNGRFGTPSELTSLEVISVDVTNYGADTQSGFPIRYQINNGPVSTEIFSGDIPPLATQTHTFSAVADLTATPSQIKSWTDLAGEFDVSNDTSQLSVSNYGSLVVSGPICLDFEEAESVAVIGDSAVAPGGLTYLDYFPGQSGEPARLRTQAGPGYAQSGTKALTVDRDPSGGNAINYLYFYFDMSAYDTLSDLVLLDLSLMEHGDEVQPNDKIWIRGSVADTFIEILDWNLFTGGASGLYFTLSAFNLSDALATNGQNFSASFQIRIGQEDNFPSTSITASDGLTIDDLCIRKIEAIDGRITKVVTPTVLCESDLSDVCIEIENRGSDTITSASIDMTWSGGNQSVGYTGNLAYGERDTICLPAVQTDSGVYDFSFFLDLTGEAFPSDNTLDQDVTYFYSPEMPVLYGDVSLDQYGDSTTLYATTILNQTHRWYDAATGGNLLLVGDTFNTGPVNMDTAYYVEALSGNGVTMVGPTDTTIGNGGDYTFYTEGLVFDVFNQVILQSVTVYPSDTGTIVVNVSGWHH